MNNIQTPTLSDRFKNFVLGDDYEQWAAKKQVQIERVVEIFQKFSDYVVVKDFGEFVKKLIENIQLAVNDGDWNNSTVENFTKGLIDKFHRITNFPEELQEFLVILGNLAKHYSSSDGRNVNWFGVLNKTDSVNYLLKFIDEQTNDSNANNQENKPVVQNYMSTLGVIKENYDKFKNSKILFSSQAESVQIAIHKKKSDDEFSRKNSIEVRNEELCNLLIRIGNYL
ncbi:MAG: hypothetical protein ACK5WP_04000 [Neisseriaceae bacterium]